ncbi:MAG: ATP-binding protein [Ilumatobacteraceae bacterium]
MRELIGREADLEAVRAALARDHRCTVVGTGGIGKTALAQVVADERRAAGTVVWIDVEPLDAPDAVAAAVATAMGMEVLPDESAATAAAAAVADSGTLVVLGVEHLVDGVAALVADWPVGAADVLVTSRVALPAWCRWCASPRWRSPPIPPVGTGRADAARTGRGEGAPMTTRSRWPMPWWPPVASRWPSSSPPTRSPASASRSPGAEATRRR